MKTGLRKIQAVIDGQKKKKQSLLKKIWQWLRYKIRFNSENIFPSYCIECGSCAEDGCCPATMCKGGFFCSNYYGPTRLGPIVELHRLKREADEHASELYPKLIKLSPDEKSESDLDLYGRPLPNGYRLETQVEMRSRLMKAHDWALKPTEK